MERKYVDVNVFVYWLSGEGELLERAKKWIQVIEKSARGEYITNTLTIYEVVVVVAGLTGRSLRDKKFVEDVAKAILEIRKLRLVPLREETIIEAVKVAREIGLDFEDAIHYATAKQYNAIQIISNDKDYEKTDLKRVF